MKHQRVIGSLIPAFCLLAGTAAPAAQTIYTDRAAFMAATTNQTVSDFSSLGSGAGYGQNFVGTDFTLTTGTALISSYDPNSTPDYEFNSGKVLALAQLSSTAGVLTPTLGTTAFGFDYGVLARSANTRVTINGTDYTGAGAPTLGFFGIVDSAGVGPISLSFAASRGIFDNVTVASARVTVPTPVPGAVPEPATWAMMIFGFGAIGGTLRRRQRTSLRFA